MSSKFFGNRLDPKKSNKNVDRGLKKFDQTEQNLKELESKEGEINFYR